MEPVVRHYQPNRELILFDHSRSCLALSLIKSTVVKEENVIKECNLTFQIDSKLYQKIETERLFNLKPEFCGSLNAQGFNHHADIEVEVALRSELLAQLAEQATDPETAITDLIACSQSSFSTLKESKAKSESDPGDKFPLLESYTNPLLFTESWFALSVRQPQESGNAGYRTLWSYLSSLALTPESITREQFTEAMEKFLKDRDETNSLMAGQAVSEAFEEIADELKNWNEAEFLKQTETVISDLFSELKTTFESWGEPDQTIGRTKTSSKGRVYQAMLDFFREEDWEFTKLQGELTLRLACKGKNGQWNCFALANEKKQRFLFYSVCPFGVPSLNRSAISEFLTRANYGIEIGNFELGFDSGEIRFKTSIDIEGDRLTSAMIKSLVYTNVLTLDQYLPGIQAVLDGVTPVDAIRAIEQPEPTQDEHAEERSPIW
jgi:hypothetical protein